MADPFEQKPWENPFDAPLMIRVDSSEKKPCASFLPKITYTQSQDLASEPIPSESKIPLIVEKKSEQESEEEEVEQLILTSEGWLAKFAPPGTISTEDLSIRLTPSSLPSPFRSSEVETSEIDQLPVTPQKSEKELENFDVSIVTGASTVSVFPAQKREIQSCKINSENHPKSIHGLNLSNSPAFIASGAKSDKFTVDECIDIGTKDLLKTNPTDLSNSMTLDPAEDSIDMVIAMTTKSSVTQIEMSGYESSDLSDEEIEDANYERENKAKESILGLNVNQGLPDPADGQIHHITECQQTNDFAANGSLDNSAVYKENKDTAKIFESSASNVVEDFLEKLKLPEGRESSIQLCESNNRGDQDDLVIPELSFEERGKLSRKMDLVCDGEFATQEKLSETSDEDRSEKTCDPDDLESSEDEIGYGDMKVSLHTKNEILNVPVTKPEVVITEDMEIQEIGFVHSVVDKDLIISSAMRDPDKTLDAGSIIVLENRELIGEIYETFGPVIQPLYSIKFAENDCIDREKFREGVKTFVVSQYAYYVFLQPLKQMKGSDASNLYDEEVNESELEFSDDEKEAKYKMMIKQKRQKLLEKGGIQTNESASRNRKKAKNNSKAYSPTVIKDENPFEYNLLQRPKEMASESHFLNINYAHFSMQDSGNPVQTISSQSVPYQSSANQANLIPRPQDQTFLPPFAYEKSTGEGLELASPPLQSNSSATPSPSDQRFIIGQPNKTHFSPFGQGRGRNNRGRRGRWNGRGRGNWESERSNNNPQVAESPLEPRYSYEQLLTNTQPRWSSPAVDQGPRFPNPTINSPMTLYSSPSANQSVSGQNNWSRQTSFEATRSYNPQSFPMLAQTPQQEPRHFQAQFEQLQQISRTTQVAPSSQQPPFNQSSQQDTTYRNWESSPYPFNKPDAF
ncbi:hypothetical protein G9A89_019908 [Geosiphon pyriformis]|nr:hypothetical protein G9A89_019908 [Geosiphon pyriformis]